MRPRGGDAPGLDPRVETLVTEMLEPPGREAKAGRSVLRGAYK